MRCILGLGGGRGKWRGQRRRLLLALLEVEKLEVSCSGLDWKGFGYGTSYIILVDARYIISDGLSAAMYSHITLTL